MTFSRCGTHTLTSAQNALKAQTAGQTIQTKRGEGSNVSTVNLLMYTSRVLLYSAVTKSRCRGAAMTSKQNSKILLCRRKRLHVCVYCKKKKCFSHSMKTHIPEGTTRMLSQPPLGPVYPPPPPSFYNGTLQVTLSFY